MTVRIMDDATKKALERLFPGVPGSYLTTSLDCFDHIPEEFRPVYRIRDFTAAQLMKARAMKDDDHAGMIEILQDGAMGPWDRHCVRTPEGDLREVPFSKEAIADLPIRWIETFFYAALRLCSPNKLERESLESSPQPMSDTLSPVAPGADAVQA